jgi:hypothetical protein
VPEPNFASSIRDRHPWRAAIVIGLLTTVAGMFYSLFLAPWVRVTSAWWIAPDAWVNLAAAHWVANGGFAYIYESTPLFVAAPIYPIFLVPVAMIGSHWLLAEGFPYSLSRPAMWLLYGPVVIATGILVLRAARHLLVVSGVRSRLGQAQWALVPITLFPIGVIYGHGEDLLALALVMWGITTHLRRRPVAAAVLFGAAIATKQWALLGLPLLAATSPRERRRQVLGVALGIPAVLLLLPLLADWSDTSKALFGARLFIRLGHRALWVTSAGQTLVATPFRLGAFIVAGLVAWRLRGDPPTSALIAGFALVFGGRILFEPAVFSYYLGPPLAFLLLHERLSEGTIRRTLLVGTLLLLYFSLQTYAALWWLGAWAMLSILVASAVADVFGLARYGRAPQPGAVIPLTARGSWPRSFGGSRWSPRTGASPARRDTTAPVRARS